VLLCVVGAHGVSGEADLEAHDLSADVWWRFGCPGSVLGSFVTPLLSPNSCSAVSLGVRSTNTRNRLGSLSTTGYGGSAPFRDSSSSAMGCPVLVASDSLMTRRCDDPRPSSAVGTFSGQDACRLRHAAQDDIKNFLPSPERRSASSSAPRPTASRKTGRCYKDVFVISEFCKGVLVMWVVIFSNYE
jgi:hypothetical protein